MLQQGFLCFGIRTDVDEECVDISAFGYSAAEPVDLLLLLLAKYSPFAFIPKTELPLDGAHMIF